MNFGSLKPSPPTEKLSLATLLPNDKFQFERHGYFVTDLVDHSAVKPVLNRVTGMKDSWAK